MTLNTIELEAAVGMIIDTIKEDDNKTKAMAVMYAIVNLLQRTKGLTMVEAAGILRCSEITLYNILKKSKKAGSETIPMADLDDFYIS